MWSNKLSIALQTNQCELYFNIMYVRKKELMKGPSETVSV